MSEDQNLYKFEEETNDNSSTSGRGGMNIPIDNLKDIGGIPLPKNEEMGKWVIVISIIVALASLWFIGSWLNDEMKFKNNEIRDCNKNFQELNVKYILKDQELQQLKNQKGITSETERTASISKEIARCKHTTKQYLTEKASIISSLARQDPG